MVTARARIAAEADRILNAAKKEDEEKKKAEAEAAAKAAAAAPAAEPAPAPEACAEELELLREIRDLLKSNQAKHAEGAQQNPKA